MKQQLHRRTDFKRCPLCKGNIVHSKDQSECISCTLVLMDDCCYDGKGNKEMKKKR